MLFNYRIDGRTILDLHLSRAEITIPEQFYEGVDGDQSKQLERCFAAILKSACTPMRVVNDLCSEINDSLYSSIYGPDHVRVQHFVYLSVEANKFNFLNTCISY
jgi:hypothetical protein